MDNDQFKQFFSFLKSVKLTENERISIRNVLISFMRENPIPAAPVYARRTSVWVILESHTTRFTGFALVLVLIIGIGTSYAAENALPGDSLYAIKIGLTEPVKGVLAVSPVEKAQWNSELLSRRLEEAATLAVQNTLDDSTRDKIESQITLRADDFAASVTKLRTTHDGVVVAASVQSDHEAALEGHKRVLSALRVDRPDESPAIDSLLRTVRIQADQSSTTRKSIEREMEKDTEVVRTAAVRKKKTARDKVQAIRTLNSNSRQRSASSTAEASTSAFQMEKEVDEGDRKLDEGKFMEAFTMYQAMLRAARATEINLDAEDRLQYNRQFNGDSRERSGSKDD